MLVQSMIQNYDTSNGLGTNYHELVQGVDCPFHSSYLDTVAYMDRDAPLDHPQSVCIWEQETGDPLRRHYTQVNCRASCLCTGLFVQKAEYKSAAGVSQTVLSHTWLCQRSLSRPSWHFMPIHRLQ